MLPEVASTSTSLDFSVPSLSAASIIARAIRSLTDPAGLNTSNLPRIVAPFCGLIFPSLTNGVSPTNPKTDSTILLELRESELLIF